MKFRVTCGGGGRHPEDPSRNDICSCLRVSVRLVRCIWEKCIFIPYKNFMSTKECHRWLWHTRRSGQETDVSDQRESWQLPWCCRSQLAVQWNADEACLKDDVPQCQPKCVTLLVLMKFIVALAWEGSEECTVCTLNENRIIYAPMQLSWYLARA